MKSPGRSARSRLLCSVLLVALALRALIPAGYMPSDDTPFALEICWDGFPARAFPVDHAVHHAHHGNAEHPGHGAPPDEEQPDRQHRAQSEHCLFAAASGAGPTPQALAPSRSLETPRLGRPAPARPALTHQRHRVQQPRAPPASS